MDWSKISQKIGEEFQLQGCFLLNRETDEWVGVAPPRAFRNYLKNQFQSKNQLHFDEVRFFKYKRPSHQEAQSLALLPIRLEEVPFHFMGLIYDDVSQFQSLLKLRVLPMHLLFWLHRLVTETKTSFGSKVDQQTILEALQEKRIYAKQLESKVSLLHEEIDRIKNSEMDLDQKVETLSQLVEKQHEDYELLAKSYQSLFEEHQQVQNEHLEACAYFEGKIFDLDQEKQALQARLAEAERHNHHGNTPLPPQQIGAQSGLIEQNQRLREQLDHVHAAYAPFTPEEVGELAQTNRELKAKIKEYVRLPKEKERMALQEAPEERLLR